MIIGINDSFQPLQPFDENRPKAPEYCLLPFAVKVWEVCFQPKADIVSAINGLKYFSYLVQCDGSHWAFFKG